MFPLEHPVLPGQLIPLSSSNRGTWLAERLHGEIEADFSIVGIERGREVGETTSAPTLASSCGAGDDPSSRRTGLDRRDSLDR